ncbi:MAG: N-acetyltransferase family protein [Pseudomonadota bacterium]
MRDEIGIEDAVPDDLEAIRAILNWAVLETTAVFYDQPRTVAQMRDWFEERRARDLPILVARGEDGSILGYASYGPFRPHDGFARTVEHSIYVAPSAQGAGLGRALLDALVSRARNAGLHVMVGGLTAENKASLALHARAGFIETGRMPEVGAKFGRWLTLVFVQKILDAETFHDSRTEP